eukprot:scaffold1947_cov207-Prasinococcus_capsulatus_cf.AAC.1
MRLLQLCARVLAFHASPESHLPGSIHRCGTLCTARGPGGWLPLAGCSAAPRNVVVGRGARAPDRSRERAPA